MRDDRERLLDIIEAIERIEKYSALGCAVFMRDPMVKDYRDAQYSDPPIFRDRCGCGMGSDRE